MVDIEQTETLPNGVLVAMVRVSGWQEVKQLPRVIRFEGRILVRTGWNSDTLVAYYRSDRPAGHCYQAQSRMGAVNV
jgi:hypothetical protein